MNRANYVSGMSLSRIDGLDIMPGSRPNPFAQYMRHNGMPVSKKQNKPEDPEEKITSSNDLNEKIRRMIIRNAGKGIVQPKENAVIVAVHKVEIPGEAGVHLYYEDEDGNVFESAETSGVDGLGKTIFGKILRAVAAPVKAVATVVTAPVRVAQDVVKDKVEAASSALTNTNLTPQEKLQQLKDATSGKQTFKSIGNSLKEEGERLNKIIQDLNFLNPATILLRNGVLASMKLNLFGAADKLRIGFLSEEEAKAKGIDPAKYAFAASKVKGLKKSFKNWGGQEEALKNAILKGKGNDDGLVQLAGLGSLGSLGVVEESAIAAAAAFVGKLALDLKPVKDFFQKDDNTPAPAPETTDELTYTEYGLPDNVALAQQQAANNAQLQEFLKQQADNSNNNKTNYTPWIIGGIGLVVVAGGITTAVLLSKKNKEPRREPAPAPALSGIKKQKRPSTLTASKRTSARKKAKAKVKVIHL